MNKIISIIDAEARLQTKMIMQTQNKCIFTYNICENRNLKIVLIKETWLSRKIHKKEEIKSVFNNHHVSGVNTDTKQLWNSL